MAPAGEAMSSNSRAMDIPTALDSYNPATYPYNRRRRGKYSKIPSPIERTDSQGGPSSSSLSSDSSWNSPPTASSRPTTRMGEETKDPRLPTRLDQDHTNPVTPQRKDKAVVRPTSGSLPPLFPPSTSPLSPSMLASSSYTSVNLNSHNDDPDEPPRLITYTKHGQGFTWNDELFLPSYMLGRYGGSRGRRKQYDGDFGEDDVQVVEVFVTDEEAEAMMP